MIKIKNASKEENDFDKFLNSLRKGYKLYYHAGETIYFPNYPVNDEFMRKFYINDNLIHSALLPNVERVGHGFAIVNNELLMNIFKRKRISLEICPTSNQALQYYDVNENPIVKLLRKGLYVTISPDDPGFFNYSGVVMDWFNLMMHTDLKPSEYYLLVKYSFIKAGNNSFILDHKLKNTHSDIEKFFQHDSIDLIKKNYSLAEINEALKISSDEKKRRIEISKNNLDILSKNVSNKSITFGQFNPVWNIYDIEQLSTMIEI